MSKVDMRCELVQDALFTLVQLDPFFALQLLATIMHDRGRVVPIYHRERGAIRRAHSCVFLVRHDVERHLAVRVHHLRVQDRLLCAAELETNRVPLLGTAWPTRKPQRRCAAPLLLRGRAVLAIVWLGRAVWILRRRLCAIWRGSILALWVRWGAVALLRLGRIVRAWRGGAIAWSCVRRGGLVSALLGRIITLLLSVGLLAPDLLGLIRGLLLIRALTLQGGIRGRPILLLVS